MRNKYIDSYIHPACPVFYYIIAVCIIMQYKNWNAFKIMSDSIAKLYM